MPIEFVIYDGTELSVIVRVSSYIYAYVFIEFISVFIYY